MSLDDEDVNKGYSPLGDDNSADQHQANAEDLKIQEDIVFPPELEVSQKTINNEKFEVNCESPAISLCSCNNMNLPSVPPVNTVELVLHVPHESIRRIASPTDEKSGKTESVPGKKKKIQQQLAMKNIKYMFEQKQSPPEIVVDPDDLIPYGQKTPFYGEDSHSLPKLGQGAFGTVYDFTDKKQNRRMALKRMLMIKDEEYKIGKHELETVKKIDNKKNMYIVKCYRAVMIPNIGFVELRICMEYMDIPMTKFYKALHSCSRATPAPRKALTCRVVHDMTAALLYLENNDIVHRDIKPDNMLVNREGKFKLCDFGLCTSRSELRKNGNCLVGTACYTPPQAAIDPIHDDMWRFGFSLMEISNGKHPYPYPDSLERTIELLHKWKPTFSTTISGTIKRVILRLLEKDATRRPNSFNDILEIRNIRKVNPAPSKKELNIIHRIINSSK